MSVTGIVLGGGKGTRLFPLTMVRSKPAVPLGGKYRLIDVPISHCLNSGIQKIFVLTQYNSASLNRHVNLTYRFGMFSRGFVDILAAEQTHDSVQWYQGTADAVRQSLRHVLVDPVEDVLVLSGDQLYRLDFREVMRTHRDHSADVTVCGLPVELERGPDFGIFRVDGQGRITEFHEKPKAPELLDALRVGSGSREKPLMASMGIYLFRTEALVRLLADETMMDFGGQVIPAALSEYHVQCHVFGGYWEDIGTIRAFYEANLSLATRTPKFSFYDAAAPIYTRPRFLPASRMENCRIRDSIISEGCTLNRSTIRGSVLGIRSVVGRDARIIDSLLMGADYYRAEGVMAEVPVGVGEGTVIEHAIIDKNARIGRNVEISDHTGQPDVDESNYCVRDGIVIVPKNAVIHDGTQI